MTILHTHHKIFQYEFNATSVHYIGKHPDGQQFDGYIAEFNFIDGFQYDPSYFAETNAITGQWIPKKYTGSYGTNGFYLNFSDNSGTTATTLGKDSSGNGNNFTPNNFSVSAGTGNDSLEDTPTNNFPTINPLAGYSTNFVSTSNGNLDFSMANNHWAISTFTIPASGKWYFECVFTDVQSGDVSVFNPNMINDDSNSFDGRWNGISFSAGQIRVDNSDVQTGLTTLANNTIYGILIDRDAGTVSFSIAGSVEGSAVNISSMVDSSTILAIVNRRQSSSGSNPIGSQNYGQRPFSHLPAGYKALSSANLPDPTILLPNQHFNTLLYTGNDSNDRDITGVGFQPDWLWIKNRQGPDWHMLQDAVRGANKTLFSNRTEGEDTDNTNGHVNSFLADGFNVTAGNSGNVNENNENYVAWNWNGGDTDGKTYTVTVVSDSGNKYRFDGFGTSAVTLDLAEGGTYIFNYPSAHPLKFSTTADGTHGGGSEYTTGVTHNSSTQVTIVVAASAPQLYYYCSIHSGMGGAVNTNSTLGSSNFAGSVQSTAKVNASAGFSIVSYTGTGANATVGHGLGVTPQAFILKGRNFGDHWRVYHQGVGTSVSDSNRKALKLNETGTYQTSTSYWNDTSPTSTTVSLGTDQSINKNTGTFVMYCFSEVAGYSKFGSYNGNGNANGTFVYTGFRPAWIMIKNIVTGHNWQMYDSIRSTLNPALVTLYANRDLDEENNTSVTPFDILSNGFKIRSTWNDTNQSGSNFIYFAFAEAPFRNSRAR